MAPYSMDLRSRVLPDSDGRHGLEGRGGEVRGQSCRR